MSRHTPHRALRPRLLLTLAAALLLSTLAPPVAATPVIDEVLQDVTCTGLLDGLAGTVEGELGGLLDPSYCHGESDAAACAPAGSSCSTEVEDRGPDGSVQVNVAGVAEPGGAMVLAVSRTAQTHACGQPLYVGTSIRFESEGVSELVASHRVSKSLDHKTPQNGADNIGICYQSPKPFVDRDGAVTMYGLLPTCDAAGGVAPCILERRKNKADAIVTMKLPSGDPVWKMVEDFLDERTG